MLAYVVIAILVLVCALVYFAPPIPSTWARDTALSLGTNLTSALIVLLVVERTLIEIQDQDRGRRRAVGLAQFRAALVGNVEFLVAMFKAASARIPQSMPDRISDLRADEFVEVVRYLDFSKSAPIFPESNWFAYAEQQTRSFSDAIDGTIIKYGSVLDADVLAELEAVRNSPFLALLRNGTRIKAVDTEMRLTRQYTILSDSTMDALVKTYFQAIVGLVHDYNSAVDDSKQIRLSPMVWADDVSPRWSDARGVLETRLRFTAGEGPPGRNP